MYQSLTATTGWMHIFDRTWPKHLRLILEVASRIETLTQSMGRDIRLEHIRQEHEVRRTLLEDLKKQARESHKQDFYRIKTSLNPCNFYDILYQRRGVPSPETGSWLFSNESYRIWLANSRGKSRVLWLKGIPGSGKLTKQFVSFAISTEFEPEASKGSRPVKHI